MPVRSFTDIHGWFYWEDTVLFRAVLEAQTQPGTLVELGAFLGRSTVVIGEYQHPGDRFVVVDLFGADPGDAANKAENEISYQTRASREHFEANYLALHDTLPEVVTGLSSEVVDHVEPRSVRFAHVDASHLYEHVSDDARNMRELMAPDGVIVFDDYRAEHTPGVAAAVWESVANHGLVPFALSPFKMYATWGDPAPHLELARRLGRTEERLVPSEQQILGHTVVMLKEKPPPPPPKVAPPGLSAKDVDAISGRVAAAVEKRLKASLRPTRSRSDYAPPVVVDWVRARRRRRATKNRST